MTPCTLVESYQVFCRSGYFIFQSRRVRRGMKREAAVFFETLLLLSQTTRRHIWEGSSLHIEFRVNLRSHINVIRDALMPGALSPRLLNFVLWHLIQGIHKRMVRFQKVTRNLFLALHGHNYTVSSGNCPSFSCATSSSLLVLTAGPRGQFPRWRRSRKRRSVCSVLRCPDLWLQCSVISVFGGSLKTAFTYHHCPCPSRNFVIG
jgi:hypothetical protein